MADVKWIKITTGVFDDEKILLIESLPEADSIIVIWFKLLCLAGKQNNSGVFMMGNSIPYTDTMLATIFRRKEATVKMALEVFEQFGMVELIDGVITIPNWEKHQSIDKMDEIREQTRVRVAKHRERQKQICCNVTSNVTVTDGNATDKIREEEIREDTIRKDKEVYFPDELLNQAFLDYIAMRKKIKSPMTDRAIQLAIKNLENLSGGDNDLAIQILEQSIMNSWKGLFPLKTGNKRGEIDWANI